MPTRQSVTQWLDQLKSGNEEAARQLFARYFDRLVQLARDHLGSLPRRVTDEEDVALSVFHSLCRGAERGQFNQLANRDDLWRLLITMTLHTVVDQCRHARQQKRGGGKVRGDSALIQEGDLFPGGFDQLPSEEPTPELLAILDEEHERLMRQLNDDTLRKTARWKLEGYKNREIAEQLGITRRSVERKLRRIRLIWTEEFDDDTKRDP